MKRPIIIVFVVILVIHLLALTFFLLMQKKDDPTTDEPGGAELIPEPEIEPQIIKSSKPLETIPGKTPAEKKSITSLQPQKTYKKPKEGIFFQYKSIPVFNFRKAVTGNISSIPETKNAKAGILLDLDTGKVLWNKNAKLTVPIASMSKMMTALIAFEDIRDNKIKYNKIVKVSKKAASVRGSSIWLDSRESFPLKVLLKAVLIKSANDAAFLVGETLGGGDIEIFVQRMNKRASELKLHAKFFNPHGLPGANASKDNAATCEDLAKLAAMLLQFPEVVNISSTPIDYIDRKIGRNKKTMLASTNKLLRSGVKGVDGIKTGYTRRAGFCLAATCIRKNRRLIAIVTGFKKSSERNECVKKLLDWGYKR